MNTMKRTWLWRSSHLSVTSPSSSSPDEIVRGGMAHLGLKKHIDLSISRLSTYKALRDEIINYAQNVDGPKCNAS